MKIKKRKFETVSASGKCFSDLKLNWAKKHGVLKLWQWWREESGEYTSLMERKVIK